MEEWSKRNSNIRWGHVLTAFRQCLPLIFFFVFALAVSGHVIASVLFSLKALLFLLSSVLSLPSLQYCFHPRCSLFYCRLPFPRVHPV
ncbi:hypothetical protein BX666DRAFT_1942064 [Dichotomocladium elegans]|nr:hypothetical protein BX666DRAFT_1942064 [Dichotomocladium elegans]